MTSPRQSPKGMPWGFKIPIFGIPLFILTFFVLAAWVPKVDLVRMALVGNTYQCSFSQALGSLDLANDRIRRRDVIRASSQLVRSDGEYSLWRTSHGEFWIPERNAEVLAHNLAELEQEVYGTGAIGVHPGDIVLDGGANIGVFTRAALTAGARTVVAIEPAPENVESLRRNFAQEIESGRVVIQPVGIWDQPGALPLRVDAGNSARNSFILNFGPATQTINVPLVTIDSIVASLGLVSVDFIKLDIEGAEKKAIAGGQKTINRFRPRLAIAMEHLDDDPVAIPAVVASTVPGYVTVCGPCLNARPDTLFFLPR